MSARACPYCCSGRFILTPWPDTYQCSSCRVGTVIETGRIGCSVPFCRRSTQHKGQFDSWVCAKHWQAVPKLERRIYSRARKRGDPSAATDRIWARLKRIAIEHRVGQ